MELQNYFSFKPPPPIKHSIHFPMKRVFLVFPILATMLTCTFAAAAPGKWGPSVVASVSASGDDTGFTITALVELPLPKDCYDVQISKALIMIYPLHYLVQQRGNGKACTDFPTSYLAKQHFDAKPLPKAVNVYVIDTHYHPKHWVVPVVIETK